MNESRTAPEDQRRPQAALILKNYWQVRARIDQAAQQAGRHPADVRLVVVTKGQPVSALRAAIDGGLRLFGENYAEEGVAKKTACCLPAGDHQQRTHEQGVEWHMIGHVQSRKARLVAEHFDWLHSLDSVKLAGRLDRVCVELDRRLPVLLECNVSGEESKFGWPAWDENNWPELLEPVSAILAMPGLDVRGLMTMAPFLDEAEQARPFFRRLRLLLEYFTGQFPQARWEELSMGMSADFPVAVQEGATLVRVGTAIMGERPAVATPEAA